MVYLNKYKTFASSFIFKIDKLINNNLKLVLSTFFLITIYSCLLFTRPFVGVYFFGFRFGEIFILLSFLITIGILFLIYSDSTIFNDKLLLIYKTLILSFFILALITNTSLLKPYAFKTSSYIWTASFLFIGSYLLSKSNKLVLKFSVFILLLIYLFSTGNYPNFLIDLFYKISDKFQFIKGSEMTIAYISIVLLNLKLYKNQKINFTMLVIFGALFFPVLMFASRGAFLGALFFFIFEIYFRRKFISNNKLYVFALFVISVPLFFISALRVDGNIQLNEIVNEQQADINAAVQDVVTKKDITIAFLGFYVNQHGYLDSFDPTTAWRLDIWQDVFVDMNSKNIILQGYGYKEIIPVMTDPTAPGRLGWDGLNENVHNYFVNIFARGGVIQLLIAMIFHYLLLIQYKERHGNLRILSFVLPLIFIASLDAAMEGVNFPIVFYSLYGYFIKNGIE